MDSSTNIKTEHIDYTTGNSATDAANDTKRRSSNRSVKRKRFDDEIVEYSLGIPSAQLNRGVGRTRTHSQTSFQTNIIGEQSSTIISPPPLVPTSQVMAAPPAASVAATSPSVSHSHTISIASTLIPQLIPTTSVANSQTVATGSGTTAVAVVPTITQEKRRSIKGTKKSKKNRNGNQIATKDLGRWKPIDDLALIIGIQQTNDLRMVHRGTKFSCKFTVAEMQSRWYSLLYEEPISRIAIAAMRNLHPEIVESIHSKALFSVQEEELLNTIKSSDNPNLETFQELLDANILVFYPARTAKALQTHWHLMKQYLLLPDQTIQPNIKGNESLLSFSDAEDLLNDAELMDAKDEAFEIELALADRKCKKEIRHLENEINRWSVLVDSLPGIGLAAEFDNQTLAVLRGRLVRFLMRSREITFGRTTKEKSVDVDLTLEGPAHKVSRKQGTIKMRSNGDFFIANDGKRPMYIDGMPLLPGNKARLNNNCVVEIAGLRFIFLVNHDLINAIRQESAKMNGPLN